MRAKKSWRGRLASIIAMLVDGLVRRYLRKN